MGETSKTAYLTGRTQIKNCPTWEDQPVKSLESRALQTTIATGKGGFVLGKHCTTKLLPSPSLGILSVLGQLYY